MDEDCFVTQVRKRRCKEISKYAPDDPDFEDKNRLVRNENVLNDLFEFVVRRGMGFIAEADLDTDLENFNREIGYMFSHYAEFIGFEKCDRLMEFFKVCIFNLIEELKDRKNGIGSVKNSS